MQLQSGAVQATLAVLFRCTGSAGSGVLRNWRESAHAYKGWAKTRYDRINQPTQLLQTSSQPTSLTSNIVSRLQMKTDPDSTSKAEQLIRTRGRAFVNTRTPLQRIVFSRIDRKKCPGTNWRRRIEFSLLPVSTRLYPQEYAKTFLTRSISVGDI